MLEGAVLVVENQKKNLPPTKMVGKFHSIIIYDDFKYRPKAFESTISYDTSFSQTFRSPF